MQSTKPAANAQLPLPLIRVAWQFRYDDDRLNCFARLAPCSKSFAMTARTVFFNELHWPVFNYFTQVESAQQEKGKFLLLNQFNPTQQQIMAFNRKFYADLIPALQIIFIREQLKNRPQIFNVRYFERPLFHDAIDIDNILAKQVNETCTRSVRRNAFNYCLDKMNSSEDGRDFHRFFNASLMLQEKMPKEDVEPPVLSLLINEGTQSKYVRFLSQQNKVAYYCSIVDSQGEYPVHLAIKKDPSATKHLAFLAKLSPTEVESKLVTRLLARNMTNYEDLMDPCKGTVISQFITYFKSHNNLPLLIKQWHVLMEKYAPSKDYGQREFYSLVNCFMDIAQYYFEKEFPVANASIVEITVGAQITKLLADFSKKLELLNTILDKLGKKGQAKFFLFSPHDDTQLSSLQLAVVNQVIQANGKLAADYSPNSLHWQRERPWIIEILTTAQARTKQWMALCENFRVRYLPMVSATMDAIYAKPKRIIPIRLSQKPHSPADSKGPAA